MTEPTPKRSRWRRVGREISGILTFVAIALTARASLADHYVVPTGSMLPTVVEGDRVVVSKAAYGLRVPLSDAWVARWSAPSRGDVVVLESPVDDTVLLKRVVAVGGDTVAIENGHLVLDGKKVSATEESETIDGRTHSLTMRSGPGPDYGPREVPKGMVLVIGDNRGNSRDSRSFGFVEERKILGKALAIYAREGSLTWRDLR